MALTNAGRNFIAGAIVGTGSFFTAANARIGVGNGTTVFAATQTDLVGASKLRKGMDATFPNVTNNVITMQSTFGPTEANYAWAEWGVFNAASAGTMLNRVAETNGTKLAGQTWIFQVSLTVEIGA